MARAPRQDRPGSFHHVMNGALGGRTLFEDRDDFRFFESLLAREVRRGLIVLLAYALVHTHYHLLLFSPLGLLAKAMANIQRDYVRRFNRRRKRYGPLFRNRFKSKPAHHLAYRGIVVRYIDDNPVSIGLAPDAAGYPYGSARFYARRQGPPWLNRVWVESQVRAVSGSAIYDPRDYAVRFPSRLPPAIRDWVTANLERTRADDDRIAALVHNPEGGVMRWMIEKALLADGTLPWNLPLPAGRVLTEIRNPLPEIATVAMALQGAQLNCAVAGLLRHACGLSLREVHARTGIPLSSVHAHAAQHAELFDLDPVYTRFVKAIVDRVQATVAHEAFPHLA